MSYEYTIKIGSNKSFRLIESLEKFLKQSELKFFYRADGQFLIKDPSIESSWNYDVSVKSEGDGNFHVALVGWSPCLYDVFRDALMGQEYHVYDDDTGDNINLEGLFRI